ncbi:MAG: M23 family metallopeptidase [Proteobacteria bacterium]|nr:M23 family metallopeptidase [Pseudomonadota bacterium]
MLISPPFLPERNASESDATWIERAMKQPPGRMSGSNAQEGSFPVSAELQWHNGLHIEAPQGANGNALPVRAVADGTVVFVRLVTSANTENQDPNHGQNYLPDKTQQAWTDNGCIILEHTGEIGADGTDTTSFTYYSLYMHLKEIKQVHEPEEKDRKGRVTKAASDRDLKKGDRLYRKDELGRAGKVYGLDNCLHFEIALGKDALATLLGKTWNKPPAWQRDNPADTPTSDGRTDSVFGSVYIYLRANTPASTQAPTAHTRQPSQSSIGQPLWLRIDYDKGQCRYQSFNAQGQPTTPDPVAEAQADYEYNLYTEANKRHNSLSAADQANSSPSGWYELLRFGRNLGSDPLPAQAAHWRQIPGPSGRPMWVDLNAQGSCKFSDADFLPIMGWNCYDDDSNASDQRCDSDKLKARIREAIDANPANMVPPGDALLKQRLGDEAVRRSMRRAICHFPTEWDSGNIQIRYQWQRDPNLSFKLDIEENWQRFVNHLKTITFDGLPQGYKDAVWHVHPAQFIAHMRKCGWLSRDEMMQCIPRNSPAGLVSRNTAKARSTQWVGSINQMARKFSLDDTARLTHLLAQVWAETGYLRLTREAGADNARYAPYIGRGLIQITWQDKYESYDKFARVTPTGNANFQLDLIANDPYHAANSSGFYWVSKNYSETATLSLSNLSRIADSGMDYDSIGKLCLWINGGGNHYDHRHIHVIYIRRVLDDVVYPAQPVIESISFTKIDFVRAADPNTGRRRIVGVRRGTTNMNLDVDHTPQR